MGELLDPRLQFDDTLLSPAALFSLFPPFFFGE